MLQMALCRMGDEVEYVRYSSTQDYYRFDWRGEPKIVPASKGIHPLILSGYGELIDPGRQTGWLRKRLAARATMQGEQEGIALRFFQEQGDSVYEVPVTTCIRSWSGFIDEVACETVDVVPGTAKPTLKSVDRMVTELASIGISEEQAHRFLQYLINNYRAGQDAMYLKRSVMAYLVPAAESIAALLAAVGFGVLMGIDLGSVEQVGDYWRTGNRTWLLLLGLGVFIFATWRARK